MSGWVEAVLSGLSDEQKIGQLLWGVAGRQHDETDRLVSAGHLGGLALAPGELADPSAAVERANHWQHLAPLPLLIAADFEIGARSLLAQGGTELPSQMAVGATASTSCAETAGQIAAREAVALGIPVILGPVLDVNSAPGNPVINTRAFSDDPHLVSQLACAYIRAAHAEGATCVGKHFPGHGASLTDPRSELPTSTRTALEIHEGDLRPYREAFAAGLECVMSGHVRVPALEPLSGLPATLCYSIMTDLLRHQLGFAGVAVTDVVGGGAMAREYGAGAAALAALRAGADVVLCSDAVPVLDAVWAAYQSDRLTRETVEPKIRRTLAMKETLGLAERTGASLEEAERTLGYAQHRSAAQELAGSAITVVRRGPLPLRLEPRDRLAVVSAAYERSDGTRLNDELHRLIAARHPNMRGVVVDETPSGQQRDRALQEAEEAAAVVICVAPGRAVGKPGAAALSRALVDLIHGLQRLPCPSIVCSFGSPYVLAECLLAEAMVCTYTACSAAADVAVATLFGEHYPTGRLPVEIPGLCPRGTGFSFD